MPLESPDTSLAEAAKRGHQDDGVREKIVAILAAGLMATIPLVLLGVWWQFKSASGSRYHGLAAPTIIESQSQPTRTMPEPRLIVESGADLAAFRAQEDIELNTYGWIDRASNIVRIPIERAMELIAQRGLPGRGSNVNNTGKSEYELLLDRSRDLQEPPIKEAK